MNEIFGKIEEAMCDAGFAPPVGRGDGGVFQCNLGEKGCLRVAIDYSEGLLSIFRFTPSFVTIWKMEDIHVFSVPVEVVTAMIAAAASISE